MGLMGLMGVAVEFDIKWSNGNDGYLKATIDGVQYMNYSGQTVFDAETPYLQFGWYGIEYSAAAQTKWNSAHHRNQRLTFAGKVCCRRLAFTYGR